MKKTIFCLITIFLFVFLLGIDVDAATDCNSLACATCVYTDKQGNDSDQFDAFEKYIFSLKATGTGNFTLSFKREFNDRLGTAHSITYDDIPSNLVVVNGTLTCPSKIYRIDTKDGKYILKWTVPDDLRKYPIGTITESFSLYNDESSNNQLPFIGNSSSNSTSSGGENTTSSGNTTSNGNTTSSGSSSTPAPTYNICSYPVTIRYQHLFDLKIQATPSGTLTYTFPENSEYSMGTSNLTNSDFTSTCPDTIIINCNDSTKKCDVERILTPEENSSLSGDDIGFGDSQNCVAVFSDLIDNMQMIFDWFKILAPALLIAYGSFDFAKAVMANDNDLLKKATSNFTKRCIAALILFFLPFLINLFLSLPGIDISDAVCGIH